MNPEWRLGVSQSEGPWNGIRQLSCCCCLFFWRKKIKMQHLMYHFMTGKWANSTPLSVLVGSPSCLVRACPRGETTLQPNQHPPRPKTASTIQHSYDSPRFCLPPSKDFQGQQEKTKKYAIWVMSWSYSDPPPSPPPYGRPK